jgi:hypothetical protein
MGAEPAGRCRILRPREVAMMGASVLATRSIVPRLSGSWSTMSPRKMTRGSCPRRARRPSTADGAAGLGNHPGSRPLVPLLISPSGQRSDGSMDSWKRSRPDHQGRVHPAGGGEGAEPRCLRFHHPAHQPRIPWKPREPDGSLCGAARAGDSRDCEEAGGNPPAEPLDAGLGCFQGRAIARIMCTTRVYHSGGMKPMWSLDLR